MPKSRIAPGLKSQENKTRIAEMVCSGKSLTETAKAFGISIGRVSQIMSEVKLEWTAKREVAVQDHIEIQLARLNETYQQANDSFLRSLEDGVTVTTIKAPRKAEKGKEDLRRRVKKADKELRITSEMSVRKGQCGDPSFLKVKADLINTSLKLLGAFPKEDKTEINNVLQINWQELSVPIPSVTPMALTPADEVEARIEAESKPPSNNGNGHG